MRADPETLAWLIVGDDGRCRWASDAARRRSREGMAMGMGTGTKNGELVGCTLDEIAERRDPVTSGSGRLDLVPVDPGSFLCVLDPVRASGPADVRSFVDVPADDEAAPPELEPADQAERLAALLRQELSVPLSTALAQLHRIGSALDATPAAAELGRDSLARAVRQISDLRGTLDTTVAVHYGGQIPVRRAWTDFAAIASDVVSAEAATDPDIAPLLRFSDSGPAPDRLIGQWDPWAIRQVTESLLSIVLMPSRRDVVRLRAARVARGAALIVAGAHETWTEAADPPATATRPGAADDTRLGLARRLCAGHGGSIEVSGNIHGRVVALAYLPDAP